MCLAQGPQRSDAGEAGTRGPSVSSQALYHWATALPGTLYCKQYGPDQIAPNSLLIRDHYTRFFLEKKGILILYQSRSVRASVTFLVNVSSPKR